MSVDEELVQLEASLEVCINQRKLFEQWRDEENKDDLLKSVWQESVDEVDSDIEDIREEIELCQQELEEFCRNGRDERFIAHEIAMMEAENRVGYPGDAMFDKGYIAYQTMKEEEGW